MAIIFVFNVYFGFFWLREILRQKSNELYKNDLLAFLCGGCLRHMMKLKKFKYTTEKDFIRGDTKNGTTLIIGSPPDDGLRIENLDGDDIADIQVEEFIGESPHINQFKKLVVTNI